MRDKPAPMETLDRSQIDTLSPQERFEWIALLWDGFTDANAPITPRQAEELEKRLATLDADRTHAISWDDLNDEMMKRSP